MVFVVSIGESCAVKHQIEKHALVATNAERYFFDYVLSSVDAVVRLLSNDMVIDREHVVYQGPFPHDYGKTGRPTAQMRVCDVVTSIHDIEDEYNDEELCAFIAALNRRLQRTRDVLKRSDAVYLIHLAQDNSRMNDEVGLKLLEVLDKVSPNHTCVVVACYNSNDDEITYVRDRLIHFPLRGTQQHGDWRKDGLVWRELFEFLAGRGGVVPYGTNISSICDMFRV